MIELAVLGLLREQPLHGYELKKRLGETLGFLWGVSYGSLYPALRRLERTGAIESVAPVRAVEVEPASPSTGSLTGDLAAARRRPRADRLAGSSRRTRKAYRITPRGEELLVELLTGDEAHTDDDKVFALKLAFCSHLPADRRVELLERRRTALGQRLQRAQRAGRATPGRGSTEANGPDERSDRLQNRYTRSLMEHRARATQRELEWIGELIDEERAAPDPGRGAWEQEGASA